MKTQPSEPFSSGFSFDLIALNLMIMVVIGRLDLVSPIRSFYRL